MSGIKAAHQSNIMHRDIKPDNILIKDLHSMKIKIADFGCSKMK
jgi:serine/threonine protein kinase